MICPDIDDVDDLDAHTVDCNCADCEWGRLADMLEDRIEERLGRAHHTAA